MYMRLAMALGRTVDELLDGVSSRELTEYVALRNLELLPNERLEMLLATLIAATVNIHRDPDSEPVEPLQFLPWMNSDDEDDAPRRTAEDMVSTIEMLNVAFGGQDLREKADG